MKNPLRQKGAKSKRLTSTYLRHPAMDGLWRRSSGLLGPGKTSMSRPPVPCCGKGAKAAGLLTIANALLTFTPITSHWAALALGTRGKEGSAMTSARIYDSWQEEQKLSHSPSMATGG